MPNPIVHFEIMGSDTAKTQEFYSTLFGRTISSDNPAGYSLALTQDEGGLGINGGIGGADRAGASAFPCMPRWTTHRPTWTKLSPWARRRLSP